MFSSSDRRRRIMARCASLVENIAREPLNPVDQWRAIERLVALGWTEEAIARRARVCRCARSASCGCSPMSCRPCSTRWRRATCPTSSSSAPSPPRRSTSRRRSGRSTSREGRSAGLLVRASPSALTKTRMYARARQLRRRSCHRPMASHGSRTCSRRPTRTAATPPMSRPSSARSRSG